MTTPSHLGTARTTLHSGKWTQEESQYVKELIKEFEAGSVNIDENISLRAFLSKALNCSPKRISKKFEGTSYNGKQLYKRKNSRLSPKEVKERREKLHELERKYQASLRVLKMVEASRKPSSVAQGQINTSLSLRAPLLNPIGAVAAEPFLPAATGMGLTNISRDARIAQLRADIALASMALESASPAAAAVVPPRISSLLELSSQRDILAGLSRTRGLPRAPSPPAPLAHTVQEQLALNQLLVGSSRPTSIVSLGYLDPFQQNNGCLDPAQQQLKRGLQSPPTDASSASKRFKLT